MRKPRLFYIGMVCTEAYVAAIGEDAYVAAAAAKMTAISSALRKVGKRSVLVSLPFVGKGSLRQRGRALRGDGFPSYFLPVWRFALIRKIFGTFALARFAVCVIKQGDTVLFYNHALEYLLALIILKYRGISVFQDIEDVPTGKEAGVRWLIEVLCYRVMCNLTSPHKITVSNQIGRCLEIGEFLAVHGVATPSVSTHVDPRWARLSSGGALRVHFGGSILPSTGLDLFCDTVMNLECHSRRLARDVIFIVTGKGDLDRVRGLSASLRSGRLQIQVHEGVERAGYYELFHSCHASLSLKCPEGELAGTTFPSKVIEIASAGLALIATSVSDVGDIFKEDEAWIMQSANADVLSSIIMEMAADPIEILRRASAGQLSIQRRFGPSVVGASLASFLDLRQSLA